jgi:hypothetical protein
MLFSPLISYMKFLFLFREATLWKKFVLRSPLASQRALLCSHHFSSSCRSKVFLSNSRRLQLDSKSWLFGYPENLVVRSLMSDSRSTSLSLSFFVFSLSQIFVHCFRTCNFHTNFLSALFSVMNLGSFHTLLTVSTIALSSSQ